MTGGSASSSRSPRREAARALALALGMAALGLALPGGGAGCAQPARPVGRVLVVGVDGLEWAVLRPLLAAGRCPNLASLIERGSFGRLATLVPTLSPLVWTTIATGRLPADHGIGGFLDEQGRMYTSERRAVPALWNIADDHGLTSNVVGWWNTWPAEAVAGVVVSGASSPALLQENWKPALVPGLPSQVHPPELADEILRLAGEETLRPAFEEARRAVFGELPPGVLGEREERLVQQTLWSLQADATFAVVAGHLLQTRPADLNLVYLGSPDVTGHRFWRHYEPDAYAWRGNPEADAALAGVIPRDYEWIDALLGRLLAAAGPDATVLVVSDHGMHAVATQVPPDPGDVAPVTGHHLDAPPGVIIAAGPGIARQGGVEDLLRSGVLPQHGSVLDLAPTVLALLGLPAARDMAGRPYTPLLAPGAALDNARLPLVASHGTGFRSPRVAPVPAEMEQAFRERFEALGYLHVPPADALAPGELPPAEEPATQEPKPRVR